MKELNDELEDDHYRHDLFKGMADYFDFVRTAYPHLSPVTGELIPFVTKFATESGRTLGMVGLNSAWMCRKSPDEREVAMGECQVRTAVKELAKLGATIDGGTVKAFIQKGRALLLLDGFDELLPQYRDTVINRFDDLRIKHDGVRLVLTGRAHGLMATAFNRLLENKVKINGLTMEQVKEFVGKWFGYFYPGQYGPGGRTAAALISELRAHPNIDVLIDNPLMLTAICILYHDQKELPGQQAEFYMRFINNMLFRRFGNEIESQNGLLKFEAGQFQFRHLTFQEFLCADNLYDNNSDCVAAIEPYWDDDRHREMVELFISHISIKSKATANGIVRAAPEQPDRGRWLKAAAALNDIQENRRDHEKVVTMTRDALRRVFESGDTSDRRVLAEAGEFLGWLGDPRDLKAFVPIKGGDYDLEQLGRVSVRSYEIGKYPVVNQWFEEFVGAGGYGEKGYWSKEGLVWLRESKVKCPGSWHDQRWRRPNAPVVGVSWFEAEAFCRWLTETSGDGKVYRLPTGAEWQIAAAGRERRGYAWGDEEDPARCNCRDGENRIEGTSAVGIFERGRTPDGIYDLSGNVWEWCGDLEGSDRVLRGGCWISYAWLCRSALRLSLSPGVRSGYYGFRLARGQKEKGRLKAED